MKTVKETANKQPQAKPDTSVKWSAKMLESFAQAERGEWKVGDINNFWGNI
jgi:hypothetical protein